MKSAYLFAAITIFLWGSTASVSKRMLSGLNSMQVLFCVSGLAALSLLVFNLIRGRGSFPAAKSLAPRDWPRLIGLGLIGIFGYNLLQYMAIDRLPAQEALIINYLWPIMTVLFACVFLRERMTPRKALALVLSFAGVAIVTTRGDLLHVQFQSLSGVLFALISAILYGLFSVLQKRAGYDPTFSTMIYYAVAFVCSGVYLLLRQDFLPLANLQPLQAAGLAWMGVFTSATAYTCWATALERGNTARISNLAFITPFLSLIYIYLLLHEEISPYSVAGLLVIVLGILVQMGGSKKAERDPESLQPERQRAR